MLSVPFNKSRVRDRQSHRVQTHAARNRHRDCGHRDKQTHKTVFREALIQTHTMDRDGRHREHEVNNLNLDSFLVKQLQEKVLFFP